MSKSRKSVRANDETTREAAKSKSNQRAEKSRKKKKDAAKRKRRAKTDNKDLYLRGFVQMVCSPRDRVFSVPMAVLVAYWRHFCRFCASINIDIEFDPEAKIWLQMPLIFPGYATVGYEPQKRLEMRHEELARYVEGVWDGDITDLPGYTKMARVRLTPPETWSQLAPPGFGFDILDKMIFKKHRTEFDNFVSVCQGIFDAFKKHGPSRATKRYREQDVAHVPKPSKPAEPRDEMSAWLD